MVQISSNSTFASMEEAKRELSALCMETRSNIVKRTQGQQSAMLPTSRFRSPSAIAIVNNHGRFSAILQIDPFSMAAYAYKGLEKRKRDEHDRRSCGGNAFGWELEREDADAVPGGEYQHEDLIQVGDLHDDDNRRMVDRIVEQHSFAAS